MRILLTGASGFLGSHIAEQLDQQGVEVRALVRSTSDTRFLERLGGVTLVRGAVDDPQSLLEAVRGVDGIVHAAGLVKSRSPDGFHRTNAQGTSNILTAVREAAPDLNRFVLVSSLAVTGPSSDGKPVPVSAEPRPVTHYGRSKLGAEKAALAVSDTVPVTILRPPLIYGPRDREMLPVFKSVKLGILPLTGSPSSVLSAIFAPDCAAACIRALHAPVPSGSTFHLDDGQTATLGDLISCIEKALGKRARIRFRIPRAVLYGAALGTELYGRVLGRAVMLTRDKLNELLAPHWVCDSTEAQAALAWTPRITFEEGARITGDWYRQEGWL